MKGEPLVECGLEREKPCQPLCQTSDTVVHEGVDAKWCAPDKRPPLIAACKTLYCNYTKAVGTCSVSCGYGNATGTFTCQHQGNCDRGDVYEETESCMSCSSCQWQPQEWDNCTASGPCSQGLEFSDYACSVDGFCDTCKIPKPERQTRRCTSGCEECIWKNDGLYTACSAGRCQMGTRSRDFTCGGGGACKSCNIKKPDPVLEPCRNCVCSYSVTEWSSCTNGCGKQQGVQTRNHKCLGTECANCKKAAYGTVTGQSVVEKRNCDTCSGCRNVWTQTQQCEDIGECCKVRVYDHTCNVNAECCLNKPQKTQGGRCGCTTICGVGSLGIACAVC